MEKKLLALCIILQHVNNYTLNESAIICLYRTVVSPVIATMWLCVLA